ncbi:hypothetical protein A3770_04p35280 [Chloropicon primus]|uniref:PLAC8 domain-containing protein n=1 Tax=Chloropicon primus TaxID=1764295 RepID=A0A5B8MNW7_9CHLO|nr:hypothetical protein A3770_04p35280 [Chloropicon primus]|mmetsp:Transcript_7685/g.21931  ORF Transcript_7685/g.21931 Transcript_7685/m.21931 type:complete len:176 (+) Transcript_7685:89-616(+)|eukprot:QDZ21010.1 hypothetical protein A3770_04p35280 [Chloropicon primus]
MNQGLGYTLIGNGYQQVVVVNQRTWTMAQQEEQKWSSGICDCTSDCESCCIGWWVPSVLYGQNKEKIEGIGQFMPDCCAFFWLRVFCPCFLPCLSYQSRQNIRTTYGLKAEPCGDCCTHFWCIRCALCQEARELKNRGATQVNPCMKPVQTVAPPIQSMPPPPPAVVQGVPVPKK